MAMIFNIYKRFRLIYARKDEKGEYSSGRLPAKVRDKFVDICRNKKGKILEIGCGEGLFISALGKTSGQLKIFAVDKSEENLIRAKTKIQALGLNHAILIVCDGRHLCFKDSAFDCVVCLNVIFNLPSFECVRQIIKEALRVIKAKNEIVIEIRNKRDFFTSLRYRFVKLYDTSCGVPLKQYNSEEIIAELEKNDSRVVGIIPIKAIFGLTSPALIIRAEKL